MIFEIMKIKTGLILLFKNFNKLILENVSNCFSAKMNVIKINFTSQKKATTKTKHA